MSPSSGASPVILPFHETQPLWTEGLPGGHHWSGRIQKGTVLQLKSLGEIANVSLFCVNSEDRLERFNMPDSLKGQHTAFLSTGHLLYSDLGRCMLSIIKDDHGWNDALCGPSRPEQIQKIYGTRTFEEARNTMFQNGLEGLLIEMSKFNLGAMDLSATLNLFSRVVPDAAGHLSYVPANHTQQAIKLRFEMNCLVFLSAAPHGLNQPLLTAQVQNGDITPDSKTAKALYQPADIELTLFKAKPLASVDVCRDSCAQNQRAFANNARYFALETVI